MRRSPTDCGVSVCDREASIMKRYWPTGAVALQKRKRRVGCGVNCFYCVNNFRNDVFVVRKVESPVYNNNIFQLYACRNQNTAVVN
jgi:hypothetical protein